MTVDWIYVIPHGDEIIDLPSAGSRTMNRMITELAARDASDTIVTISPHGLSLPNSFSVVNTESFYAVTKLKTTTLRGIWKNDRAIAERIVSESGGLAEEARFIAYSGRISKFPMDFGTSIPLHFFRKKPIVMMGQTRNLDRQRLVEFGKMLYSVCEDNPKHIGILISADQAHTHSEDGPYGYTEDAQKYESIVKDSLKEGRMDRLLDIDDKIIKNAKPDSFWNMCALHGMLVASGRRAVFDFGYVEVYFGMMLAHTV